MKRWKIALIGERDLAKTAHRGIEASLALYRRDVDSELSHAWINSASITPDAMREIFAT